MGTLVSLEIRWFLGGRGSSQKAWFQEALPGPRVDDVETRRDLYLYQPQHDQYGVKLRRSKPTAPYSLEIKWREEAKPYEGPNGLSGQIERWHKWVWDAGRTNRKAPFASRGPWVSVSKRRWQRKYRFDGKLFEPLKNGHKADLGAAVEFTSLTLLGEPYATVLLETFAPTKTQQYRILDKAMDCLWREYPAPLPSPEQSYGYPRWLARFAIPRAVVPRQLSEF